MIVEVTQQHIDKGVPGGRQGLYDDGCCPLEFALSTALGEPVRVGTNRFIPASSGPHPLPRAAIAFRRAFDAGRRVTPFRFEVTI